MNGDCQNRPSRPGWIVLAAALLLLVLSPAEGVASSIALEFGSQRPGSQTAMELHIAYTNPDDPSAKPPPIRELVIDAPAGTGFDAAAVPVCEASDAELMASGASACPQESRIGGGTIVVTTGFGPPFDPFASPTPVFSDGNGWLEVSQDPSSSATIAVTRLAVDGNRIAGKIGASPGGPPDFQSAVSTVDLGFPAGTRYVTTPPVCPRDRHWLTTARYTFGDGSTEAVSDETPCKRRRARIHTRVRPNDVRSGEQARVRVTLRSKYGCASNATVRIGKRPPLRTNRAGRVALRAAFRRPGPRRVTASKAGCRRGRASFSVRP